MKSIAMVEVSVTTTGSVCPTETKGRHSVHPAKVCLSDSLAATAAEVRRRSGKRGAGGGDSKRAVVAGKKSLNAEDGDSLPAFVRGCVSALFTLLEVYGLRRRSACPKVMHSYHRTCEHWIAGSTLVDPQFGWIKYVKYKFAAFVYSHTVQMDAPPPRPWDNGPFQDNPRKLASSSVGRYIDLILNSSSRLGFLSSIGHVKSACPRPGKAFLDASVKKTVASLTTVHVDKPDGFLVPHQFRIEGVAVHLDRESFCDQLNRTVDEIFAKPQNKAERKRGEAPSYMQYDDTWRHKCLFPATSATYSNSRGHGGNVAESVANIRSEGLDCPIGIARRPALSQALPVIACPILVVPQNTEIVNDYDEIWGGNAFFAQMLHEHEPMSPAFDIDVRSVAAKGKEFYEMNLKLAEGEASMVTPVALAEALKARIITKGIGCITNSLHPLQKFMWSILHRLATFQLIGSKPVDAWIIQERLGIHLPPDEYYLSGDYSAATDNLAPWVSECIANRIADRCGLTQMERSLFLRSLTGNVFLEGAEMKPQIWGQLMGSIVSFPVLCIANAAMCRWSLEIGRERVLSLHSSGMLINGDDVCFRASVRTYKVWERITAYGGLESSLGKTFLSPEFVQINSANFFRRKNDAGRDEPIVVSVDLPDGSTVVREQHFIEPGYVNLGLMFGLKRSAETKSHSPTVSERDIVDCGAVDSIGARAHELIRVCPSEVRDTVMLEFIHRHKQVLDKVRVPWYVPEKWGGVGLPSFLSRRETQRGCTEFPVDKKPDFGPSRLDRQVLARIRENPVKYPVSRLPRLASWQMHQVVMKMIPKDLYTLGSPTEEQERSWTGLYSAATFSQLFWEDPSGQGKSGIDRLFIVEEDGKIQSHGTPVLKQNQRTWERARTSGRLPAAVSIVTVFDHQPARPILLARIVRDDTYFGPQAQILVEPEEVVPLHPALPDPELVAPHPLPEGFRPPAIPQRWIEDIQMGDLFPDVV